MIRRWGILLAGLVVAVAAHVAVAQQPELAVGSARYGAAVYVPEKWALVYSTIENPGDADAQVMVVARMPAAPNVAYATEAWIPAGAKRQIIQPLRIPQVQVPRDRNYATLDLKTSALNAAGTREFGRGDGLISVVTRAPVVAVIMDNEVYPEEAAAMATLGGPSMQDIEAEKEKKGTRRTLVFANSMLRVIRDDACPATGVGWDAVDYVCVVGRDPQLDAAQLDALRRYIVSGGRIWIMADRVNPTFCRRLLGDDYTVEVVDRVQKHSILFETGRQRNQLEVDLGEQPVDMARVVADGFETLVVADDWPAALTCDVGQGRLIITTVGARAWLDEDHWDLEPLRDLTTTLYRPVNRELLTTEDMASFAEGQIGYEIIDRDRIAVVLIAFAVVLLVGGLALAKFNRLEWQAPGAIVIALIATFVIMAMGKAHQSRSGTAPTIAGASWARADVDQQYAHVKGSIGFYSPTEIDLPITASRGGVVWPTPAKGAAGGMTMVWRGSERWEWKMPPLKPGVIQEATLQQTLPLTEPTYARLVLTESQVVGELQPGPFKGLSDLVLATPAGHMLPQTQGDTKFTIPVGQRPAADEFLAGSISVTEKQARRQDLYRALLNPETRTRDNFYPSTEMVLMGWASAVDNGVNYVDGAQRRDETLVSIPVSFVRPEPGATLTIPPQLIKRHWYRGPRAAAANIYDESTDQFIAHRQVEQEFVLGFRLPVALLPLEFESLKLEVDMRASGWDLHLLPSFDGGEALAKRSNPNATATFELTDYEGFTPDDQGSIYVRCRVAAPAGGAPQRAWNITQMRLTARAIVPETSP